MFQTKMRTLFLTIAILVPICSLHADTKKAWGLLFNNKPVDASEEFKKTLDDANGVIAGESYRGLAATEMFMGNYDSVLDYGILSYQKDGDILKSASRPDILLLNRSDKSKNGKRSSAVIDEIIKKGGIFSGWYQDAQLKSYLNSGDMKKARTLHNAMGILSQWKWIGPFENISSCGFSNVYPPEKEIKFDKEYDGKNGNIAKWNNLFTTESRGWIFLDNITTEYNSIFYFTNTVISKSQRDVYIAFGASGTFKVFVNGNLALQDSVFRNTGIDAYMQKVTLRKGVNRILVKIGHEGAGSSIALSGRSNFLLRILDKDYNPINDLQTIVSDTSVTPDNKPLIHMSNSPVIDSITSFLHSRIKKDSTDYDALYSLITTYNMYEMTNESQKLIQHFLRRLPSSSLLYSSLAESQMRGKKYTDASVSMKKAYDLCNLNMIAWNRQIATLKSNGNVRTLEDFLNKSPELFKSKPATTLTSLSIAIAKKNKSDILNIISELEEKYKENSEVAMTLISIYAAQGMLDKAEKLLTEQVKANPDNTTLYNELAELSSKRGNRDGAVKWYTAALNANPEDPDGYLFLSNHYYEEKNYSLALQYVEKCALLMPANANVFNLKGSILSSMGKTMKLLLHIRRQSDIHQMILSHGKIFSN